MIKNIITILCLTAFISACAGQKSTTVKTMQRKDKQLTCKEILLEMNEAEFYKSTAEKNKGPSIGSMLMPLGYISTYMNAEEAIGAAGARVDYLDRIYQIMECDAKSGKTHQINTQIMPQGGSVPIGAGTAYPSQQLIDRSGLMDNIPNQSYRHGTGEIHFRNANPPRLDDIQRNKP